jgi:drug/metabolite transporter (DMT)-like permease
MPHLGEICALLAPMGWAVALILFKRTEGAPPLALNLFKNTVGVVLLSATMVALGIAVPTDRSVEDWARVIGSGVLGLAVADTFLFEGLKRIGAARFALVDTTYAPMIVLLSWVLFGEAPTTAIVGGGAAVVVGVTVASVDPRDLKFSGGREIAIGMVSAFLAVLGTATAVLIAKPVLVNSDLIEITWTRLTAGLTAMILWAAATGKLREATTAFRPGTDWKTLVPASFFGTYLSLIFWLGGYKWAPAAVAAVLNQLATVYILVLARVFLRERIAPRQAVGSLVAATGALWIVWNRA